MLPAFGTALVLFLAGLAAGGLSALQAAINGRLSLYTGTLNAVLISITVSFAMVLTVAIAARSPRGLSYTLSLHDALPI